MGIMISKHVQKIIVPLFLILAFLFFVPMVSANADTLMVSLDASSCEENEEATNTEFVTSKGEVVEKKKTSNDSLNFEDKTSKKDASDAKESGKAQDIKNKQESNDCASKTNLEAKDKKEEVNKSENTSLNNTKAEAQSSKASKTVESQISATDSNNTKFQVGVVKNGWVTANSKTYYYEKNQAQTGWVVNDKLNNYGLQRYWLNSEGALQKSKLLAKNVVGWDAYATSKGYVARGKYKETDGKIYLANNDGKLETSGWLVTSAYDGASQRYYLDSKTRACTTGFFRVSGKLYHGDANNGYELRWKTRWGSGILLIDNDGVIYEKEGWLSTDKYDGRTEKYRVDKSCDGYYGAHLGMFTISGKQYYAFRDSGFLFRNDYDYIESHWYVANNDGVLTNSDARFAVIERYVSWMLSIAADDSHGYDQAYRWGERGDYDCSSLTISALRVAGVDTRWATYTGNMRSALTLSGFYCRGFDNLKRGDILLNDTYHVAVYIGNGMLVQASGNEWGGAVGGAPGDQTGYEIWSCSYYDYPWDTVLRYDC